MSTLGWMLLEQLVRADVWAHAAAAPPASRPAPRGRALRRPHSSADERGSR